MEELGVEEPNLEAWLQTAEGLATGAWSMIGGLIGHGELGGMLINPGLYVQPRIMFMDGKWPHSVKPEDNNWMGTLATINGSDFALTSDIDFEWLAMMASNLCLAAMSAYTNIKDLDFEPGRLATLGNRVKLIKDYIHRAAHGPRNTIEVYHLMRSPVVSSLSYMARGLARAEDDIDNACRKDSSLVSIIVSSWGLDNLQPSDSRQPRAHLVIDNVMGAISAGQPVPRSMWQRAFVLPRI